MSLLVATTVTAALLIGFFPRLLEGARAPLAARLAVEEARVSDLHGWLTMVLAPMLVLSGLFIDQWGCHDVLFIGVVLMATSLATLAVSHSYRGAVFAVMTLGAGGACLTTAVTVLMPGAFFGESYPANSVNLGYVFVGLAALATPGLLGLVHDKLGFRNGTLVLALLTLVVAALAALTPDEEYPAIRSAAPWAELLGDTRLWMVGVVFLLYYPLERSVHTWPGAYLTELHFTPRALGWLWAGFWALFLAARLVTGLLLVPGYEAWVALVLVLLVAVIHGNLVGVYDRGSAGWGFLSLGGCFGPVFPLLLGLSLDLFHDRATGSAIGTVYAVGLVGSVFFQPFMKVFSYTHRVRATMRLPMILGLILGVPLLVLALIRY